MADRGCGVFGGGRDAAADSWTQPAVHGLVSWWLGLFCRESAGPAYWERINNQSEGSI